MSQRKQTAREPAPRAPRTGRIGAVEHAIDVLRCLSEVGAPLGVNDIARRVGRHKSSVSRLVATLETARLIQRDTETGRISLGMGLLALAAPLLSGFELRDVVRPLLAQLAQDTGETVSFGIWDGTEAVSIEQVPGANSVQAFSAPGHRNPAHCTAAGKALLAHMEDQVIAAYCSQPLRRFTPQTITRVDALRAELRQCRSQGYAINTGEFEIDVGALAAVVFDRHSKVIGCVTATVPMYRFGADRRSQLASSIVQCAAKLSAKLGYPAARKRSA